MHGGALGKLRAVAAALYKSPPDPKKLQGFGLKPSDYASKPVLVWPENRTSVQVFIAMRRRWSVGMGGPVGLNLAELPYIWPLVKVRRRDRRRVVSDLMVMEDAALEVMHAKE